MNPIPATNIQYNRRPSIKRATPTAICKANEALLSSSMFDRPRWKCDGSGYAVIYGTIPKTRTWPPEPPAILIGATIR